MKRLLPKLLVIVLVCYASYAHYLSYFHARRLIYASFNDLEGRNGSGTYNVQKVEIDSITYRGKLATIHYRLTGSYSNGSIKDFKDRQYDAEPTYLDVRHGLLGWRNEWLAR